MKYLAHLLTYVIISLTITSCGTVWDIYESQINSHAPQHSLESNNEYETIWNLSDIQVANSQSRRPAMISSPSKIIIEGSYVGTAVGSTIFGLDSSNGSILWEIAGSPGEDIIANDKFLFRGTSGTAVVYSHNIENGELLWGTRLPLSHSTGDLYFADNKLFINTDDSKFFILNENGEVLGDFQISSRTFLALNGILYMEDGLSLKAIDFFTKKELWLLDIDKSSIQAPIFDNGEIFLRTRFSPINLYSIDQYVGKVNWMITQDILSNLCVLGNKIYFISSDSNLIAINRYTGQEISRATFSPRLDLDNSIGEYFIACDATNNLLAISFGDNTQIMGLRIITP